MDGDIRKATGPKATLAQLTAQALAAGERTYGLALSAYVRQFGGRRPSYEERCEADPLEGAEPAFEAWVFSSTAADACAYRTPRVWGRLLGAFLHGWQHAADGI